MIQIRSCKTVILGLTVPSYITKQERISFNWPYLHDFPRVKNTKAAEQILEKEPTTAEQFDKSGLNFLHVAINAKDIEAVLFLVQVRVDVNSRTRVS